MFGVAGIAECANPFARAAWTRVIARQPQHVGAAELAHAVADVGRSDLGIISRVGQQPVEFAFDFVLSAHVLGGDGHDLEQTLGTRTRNRVLVELGLLTRNTQQECGLRWFAERRESWEGMQGIGVYQKVLPARDGRFGIAKRELRIADGIGEVGCHRSIGFVVEIGFEVGNEDARDGGIGARFAGNDNRLDRIEIVEALDLFRGWGGWHRDGNAAIVGIELQLRELAVERIDFARSLTIVPGRRGRFVGTLGNAPQPISRPPARQRAIGGFGGSVEVLDGGGFVLQEAPGEPTRHERLLFQRIDGQRTDVLDELVGELGITRVEGGIGEHPPFGPPFIEVGRELGVDGGGQHQPGRVVDLVGAAQDLDTMIEKAGIALGVVQNGRDSGLGVLFVQEYGEPGFSDFLVVLGEAVDLAADGACTLGAVGGPADIVDQQTVEPPLMIGGGEEFAEPLHEPGFEVGRDAHLAPHFDGARLGAFGVAQRQVGGRECGKADAVFGLLILERGHDAGGLPAFGEHEFLEALVENAAVGPRWIFGQERLVFANLAVTAAQPVPVDELAPNGVLDGIADVERFDDVLGGDGLDAIANAGGILDAEIIAAHRGNGCVKGLEMFSFACGRGERGLFGEGGSGKQQ